MNQSQAALVLLLVSLTVFVAMLCDVAIDMWWSGYKWLAVGIVASFLVITAALFQLM